jgi:hypothetical protein
MGEISIQTQSPIMSLVVMNHNSDTSLLSKLFRACVKLALSCPSTGVVQLEMLTEPLGRWCSEVTTYFPLGALTLEKGSR